MLKATKGFSVVVDGEERRVEPGTELADNFVDGSTVDYLLSKGALELVTDATPPADKRKSKKPSPNTPDESQGASEAPGGEEASQ